MREELDKLRLDNSKLRTENINLRQLLKIPADGFVDEGKCSFCGKSKQKRVFEGEGALICVECVISLCEFVQIDDD